MRTQTTIKLIATIVLLSALSQPVKSTNVAVCVDEIFGLVKDVIGIAKSIAEHDPLGIIEDVKKLLSLLDLSKIEQCKGVTLEEIIAYVKAYVKKDLQACINQEIQLIADGKQFIEYCEQRKIMDIIKQGEKVIEDCRSLIHVCENVIPGELQSLKFE